MARRWTEEEEVAYRSELQELYVRKNLTIREVGIVLGIAEQTVFRRMRRLGIASTPERKPTYLNTLKSVSLPRYSSRLAEFIGIMLGDGHLSHFQAVVTLGTKEASYADHVRALMQKLFSTNANIGLRKDGFRDVYLSSTVVTAWLYHMGLVSNKVREQVSVPLWIFEKPGYMRAFLRGFFDTDGSIYKLRFGVQISLTNKSRPLLVSLRKMLVELGYRPSEVGDMRVYVTRVPDVKRFFAEIRPANQKHQRRYAEFIASVGTEVVKRDAL